VNKSVQGHAVNKQGGISPDLHPQLRLIFLKETQSRTKEERDRGQMTPRQGCAAKESGGTRLRTPREGGGVSERMNVHMGGEWEEEPISSYEARQEEGGAGGGRGRGSKKQVSSN